MGYLPLDDLGATNFFQLVSARHERGSIILKFNKSYGEWGSIFGDPVIATAILDQSSHHSTTTITDPDHMVCSTIARRTA
jgi:DNA replication protein DnaC